MTKNEIKRMLRDVQEKASRLQGELEELQETLRDEADSMEPYEGKDDLTEAQEQKQDWLNSWADSLEGLTGSLEDLSCADVDEEGF